MTATAPTKTKTQYEAVIGLETHCQLTTNSKIFCNCSTQFGAPPNTNVCPVCLGMPGVLPVLNEKVLEYAVKAGLALNCKIAPTANSIANNIFILTFPKIIKSHNTTYRWQSMVG